MLALHERNGALLRRALPVGCALVALAAAGCGEGSGEPSGPTVTQRVTRDFGREALSSADGVPMPRPPTVMRLLRDQVEEVKTVYDGDFVETIDGARQHTKKGDLIWAYYVNGIEADELASDYKIFPDDVVQWDLRDWYVTLDVRATVGAFPQTFTRGFEGKRFPVLVECEDDSSSACRRVKRVLGDAGVALGASPGRAKTRYEARVLVGPWDHWRRRPWPHAVDDGPAYSGVFARFSPAGDELRLLDWNGHPVRAERGDVGLVAAMRPTELDFMWLVTGLNDAGVERAARALDPDRLRDAYALVVTPDGDEKIPLEPPR